MKYCNCPALRNAGYKYSGSYCAIGTADDSLIKFLDGESKPMKRIVCNTETVQAILDHRKTVIRLPIKPQPNDHYDTCTKPGYFNIGGNEWVCEECGGESLFEGNSRMKAPYRIGDILWVAETFAIGKIDSGEEPDGRDSGFYISQCATDIDIIPKEWAIRNGIEFEDVVWKPSVHLPKEAARIFLKVTDVRVERLQDISEEDARNEGIKSYWAEPHQNVPPFIGAAKEVDLDLCQTRKEAYSQIWENSFKQIDRPLYSWDANPWVWVIEFKSCKNSSLDLHSEETIIF